MPKRILLIGGPSTGKTTLLNFLKSLGYPCLDEISRDVIKKAQNDGIDQLFLEKPLLFSRLLKDARISQYHLASAYKEAFVFYDRGIPDTVAYMDFIGQQYPEEFTEACTTFLYDQVFVLPPWRAIHTTDSERYESFDQALEIQAALIKTYKKYQYDPIEVPIGPLETRAQFIIAKLVAH